MTAGRLLAVIPARAGSKGLPGKNVRPFAGLPLIAHSILFAKLCPEITRCVVSTDSADIAAVARQFGGDVPGLRPAALAADETPVWAVVRHVLAEVEREEGRPYDWLLLLDPTSPAREPADVSGALARLAARPEAVGILGVSEPTFNPVWHSVIEDEHGWARDLIPDGGAITRRQQAPRTFRINGSVYLWRTAFVRAEARSWRQGGRHLLYEIPELRAMSIDTLEEFRVAELLVTQGLIRLPWLAHADAAR